MQNDWTQFYVLKVKLVKKNDWLMLAKVYQESRLFAKIVPQEAY